MAEKKMRKCAVCRQDYHFCPRCGEDKNKPTWYFTFCSADCKEIYRTTSDFEGGYITAKEAKDALDKLDMSRLLSFGESYKASIAKINAEAKKETNVEKDNEETAKVAETTDIVEAAESGNNTSIKKSRKKKDSVE